MNVIENLLTRTRAAADQRQAAARTRYRELVQAAGSGGDIDPDAIAAFLDTNEFSLEQFQADVEMHAKRLAWRADAAALTSARKKLAEAESAAKAANDKLEAAVAAAHQEYNAAVAKIEPKLIAAKATVARGEEAEGKLASTGIPQDLLDRLTSTQAKRKPITEQVARVKAMQAATHAELPGLEHRAKHFADEAQRLHHDRIDVHAGPSGSRTKEAQADAKRAAEELTHKKTWLETGSVNELADLAKQQQDIEDEVAAIQREIMAA